MSFNLLSGIPTDSARRGVKNSPAHECYWGQVLRRASTDPDVIASPPSRRISNKKTPRSVERLGVKRKAPIRLFVLLPK